MSFLKKKIISNSNKIGKIIIKNLDVGVAPPLSDVDSASAIGNFLIY